MSNNEETVTRAPNREMSFIPIKEGPKRTVNSTSEDFAEINHVEQKTIASAVRCLTHPEEDLQFFCYNNGKPLCAECLVKGEYAGMEIVSLRRAGEKMKSKLEELLNDANGNLEMCELLENEVRNYETQISELASNHKDEITKRISELRLALEQKEQELLNRVAVTQRERQNKVKLAVTNLESYMREMNEVKNLIEESLSSKSDLDICQYYSTKAETIVNELNAEINPRILKSKKILERYQSRDQTAIDKLQESCDTVSETVKLLTSENKEDKSERSHSPTNSPKTANRVSFVTKSVSTRPSASKILTEPSTQSGNLKSSISKEISITESLTPFRPESYRNFNSLSRTLYGEDVSPISTIQQLSSRTPKVTEQDSTKNSYLNQNNGQSLLESYRDQFSKKNTETRDFLKPVKNEVSKSQSMAFNTKFSASKLLLESSASSSRSPRFASTKKWVIEPIMEQSRSTKNIHTTYTGPLLSRNTPKGSFIKNNEVDDFGIGNRINTSKKSTKQLDVFGLTDNSLKQKLEKLSYTIFN